MHVKWRGLELPASVILDEKSATDTFGRFTIEPFERGFGTTIGNSLRRILLSSIEGSAITSIRVKVLTMSSAQLKASHKTWSTLCSMSRDLS